VKRAPLTTLAFLAFGVAGVAWLQPSLAATLHATKAREDVYAFPSPGELRLATLGHEAAVADLLWVKVRIEYGIHWVERRPFRDATRYLDAITELDPSFGAPYDYADALVMYQPVAGGDPEARWVNSFLERGTKERPADGQLWAHYGQFLVFMAPTYVKDKPTLDAWRHEGALALARSVELGADVAHGRTAAGMLSEEGQRDAAIRTLQNAFLVSDDPQEKTHIAELLVALHGEEQKATAERHAIAVQRAWTSQYPFLTRGEFLLIGPKRDPAACAGRARMDAVGCTDVVTDEPAEGAPPVP
jgi:hypothetical protein